MKTNSIKTICVNASTKYDVVIGPNLIKKVGDYVSKVIKVCKIALITDDVVDKLYSDIVTKSLTQSGYKVEKFVFKNGEQS
jgi:3-dehydroquinate synthase